MFQVEIRNVIGVKKAPNSGEGWALCVFTHAPGGKPALEN
jgi:hypothetical protein